MCFPSKRKFKARVVTVSPKHRVVFIKFLGEISMVKIFFVRMLFANPDVANGF